MGNKIPTFDELLNKDIYYVTEDEKNYYFKPNLSPGVIYDTSLWVVDKETKSVSYLDCMEYVFNGTHDRTKPVDISLLRKGVT